MSSILEGGTLELAITTIEPPSESIEATLVRQHDAPEPAPIQVVPVEGVAGTIRPGDHDDVAILTSMGIPLSLRVTPCADAEVLTISLAPEPELAWQADE